MTWKSNFYHQFYGPTSGRKWVFLHGLMGNSANWRKIISGLEETENCFVYDQRGHGRSFQPEQGYAAENYAEDLYKILLEIGWQQINLVGHSMGGRNALAFAAKYPQMIQSLIIEDIGPIPNIDAIAYYENLLNQVPTPFAHRQIARDFMLREYPKRIQTKEKPETIAMFLYTNLHELPNGTVDWRFYKPGILASVIQGRSQEWWSIIEQLQMPTLWIRGENSNDLPREVYLQILEKNKIIQGVEIHSSGHWVHIDQPDLFVKVIKDFVDGR